MNIFFLDETPSSAARYQCDQHVVKMPTETAQMLSAAHHLLGDGGPYRISHHNHPCTKWVRETDSNYAWAVELGLALCASYSRRYQGRKHATAALFEGPLCLPPARVPRGPLTPPALAMPPRYHGADAVHAYRLFYVGEKLRFARWRHSPRPYWIEEYQDLVDRLEPA